LPPTEKQERCVTIRPEHRKTFPRSRIPETLLMFIRVHGGPSSEVNSEFVYAPLADYYELSDEARRLSMADYHAGRSAPGIAWNSEIDSAVRALKKDGYLTGGTRSRRAAWRLTPYGVQRADFWLKRMIEKSASLSALKVDPDLASLEPQQ
jgi:hypothetical protein